MSERLLAVRTSKAGNAVFGTIISQGISVPKGDRTPLREKSAGEAADYHHPKKPTLLGIATGSHQIFIDSPSGELSVVLEAGQQILFMDFDPGFTPGNGLRAGHRSVAGPNGAKLLPVELHIQIDLDALDWQEGLPEAMTGATNS